MNQYTPGAPPSFLALGRRGPSYLPQLQPQHRRSVSLALLLPQQRTKQPFVRVEGIHAGSITVKGSWFDVEQRPAALVRNHSSQDTEEEAVTSYHSFA